MREIRKLRCFFSIEAMTVILISLLVVIPLGMWMQHYTSTFYRITKDDSMEQDIRYLLTDIHHSWMMFSYEPSYVRPTGDVTESIISFKKIMVISFVSIGKVIKLAKIQTMGSLKI